jgi:GNAT superfamily N-acetyltransferase
MTPTIRPASHFDLLALFADARRHKVIYKPGTALWGMWDGDTLIAMAGLYPLGPRTVELKSAYVQPDYRGQGLHGALIDYRLDVARERGFSYAISRCNAGSLPGLLHRGFTVKRAYKTCWLVQKGLT